MAGEKSSALEKNINIHFKSDIDVNTLDNRHQKKLEKYCEIINTSIKNLIDGIDNATIKLADSISKVVSSLSSSASAISKITSDELSLFKTNLGKVNDVVNDFIKDASKHVDKDAIELVNKNNRVVSDLAKNQRFFSKQTDEDRNKANSNMSDSMLKFGSSISFFGTTHSKEIVDLFSKTISGFKSLTGIIQFFSEMDNGSLNRSFDILHKANEEAIAKEVSHLKEVEEHKDRMYEKELAQIDAKQKKKEENAQRNFEQSLKFNEQTHQLALARRTKWFDELMKKGIKTSLFGEKDENGKKKSGTGLLGGDIKSGILNGLKGMLIGGILGAITKVFSTVIKVITMPLQVMKKLASGIVGFLKKSLNSAETFKKLIEMVMMPFTLLFTLLFAPILMRLSPLLVELVNKVVEKWDVLDQVGEKVAYILGYFFDDNNWFSLGNLIDMLIGLLDEFSNVALSTFTTALSKGEEGMQVIGDVVANIINWASNKFIEFMASSEGVSLFDTIGRVVGTMLYDAVKIAFVTIIPLVMSNIGMFKGIFEALMSDIANGFRDLVLSPISNWFIDIGNFFIEHIINPIYSLFGMDAVGLKEHTSFSLSGTSSAIQELSDYLSSNTVTEDGQTNYIQTFNNWSTTNWNQFWKDRSNMYSLKGTDT